MTESEIKHEYIELFGFAMYPNIKNGIDSEGWYSNERNGEWLSLTPDKIQKLDFRNGNTEFRPITLRP